MEVVPPVGSVCIEQDALRRAVPSDAITLLDIQGDVERLVVANCQGPVAGWAVDRSPNTALCKRGPLPRL